MKDGLLTTFWPPVKTTFEIYISPCGLSVILPLVFKMRLYRANPIVMPDRMNMTSAVKISVNRAERRRFLALFAMLLEIAFTYDISPSIFIANNYEVTSLATFVVVNWQVD